MSSPNGPMGTHLGTFLIFDHFGQLLVLQQHSCGAATAPLCCCNTTIVLLQDHQWSIVVSAAKTSVVSAAKTSLVSAAKTSLVSAAKTSAVSAAKTSALSAAKTSALKTSASSHISMIKATTCARLRRAHVVVGDIEM